MARRPAEGAVTTDPSGIKKAFPEKRKGSKKGREINREPTGSQPWSNDGVSDKRRVKKDARG